MAQSEIIHDRKNGSIGPPRHEGAARLEASHTNYLSMLITLLMG